MLRLCKTDFVPGGWPPCFPIYPTCAVVGMLIWSFPCFRNTLQGFLMYLFDTRRQKMAAAGIGGLLGSRSPAHVVRVSRSRFRCVRAEQVSLDVLASRTPDLDFYGLSSPQRLGHCDAFISHSWRDDPTAKWEALQEWQQMFLSIHGREPLVWIDKMCLDQANLEDDLMCLPVFISGSAQMLVLAGRTYLSRLWCMVELFAHHHVASGEDRLQVLPVIRDGHREEDVLSMKLGFATFDVEHCQCSVVKDRDVLPKMIMVACGSAASFNQIVVSILDGTCASDEASSSTTESSEDERSDTSELRSG